MEASVIPRVVVPRKYNPENVVPETTIRNIFTRISALRQATTAPPNEIEISIGRFQFNIDKNHRFSPGTTAEYGIMMLDNFNLAKSRDDMVLDKSIDHIWNINRQLKMRLSERQIDGIKQTTILNKSRVDTIDIVNAGLRINISLERGVEKYTPKKKPDIVRIKTRHSWELMEGVRMDYTFVHTLGVKSIKQKQTEIEIEIDPKMFSLETLRYAINYGTYFKQFMTNTEMLLHSTMRQEPLPIVFTDETFNLVKEINALYASHSRSDVMKEADIVEETRSLREGVEFMLHSDVPKPVSLLQRHLHTLDNYAITPKLDGTRFFIYFGSKHVYMFKTPRRRMLAIEFEKYADLAQFAIISNRSDFAGTLVDVELYDHVDKFPEIVGQGQSAFIFDVMFYRNEDVRGRNYIKRMDKAKMIVDGWVEGFIDLRLKPIIYATDIEEVNVVPVNISTTIVNAPEADAIEKQIAQVNSDLKYINQILLEEENPDRIRSLKEDKMQKTRLLVDLKMNADYRRKQYFDSLRMINALESSNEHKPGEIDGMRLELEEQYADVDKQSIGSAEKVEYRPVRVSRYIDVFSCYKFAIQKGHELEDSGYETDGLIYQPIDRPYNNEEIYKHKPLDKTTIDFSLVEESRTDSEIVFQLHTSSTSVRNRATAQFTYQIDRTDRKIKAVVKFDLEKNGNRKYKGVKFMAYDGSILECSWNDEEKVFEPYRVRYDKYVANRRDVANNVWITIVNHLSDDIMSGNDSAVYRAFHNNVKQNMLATYIGTGSTIVDFGSGQGGDIAKWLQLGLTVIAVEPNKEQNEEFMRRIAEHRAKYLPAKSDNARELERKRLGMEKIDRIRLLSMRAEDPNLPRQVKALLKDKRVDCITSFFSLTFFFKNATMLEALARNVKEILGEGGRFVGAVLDGARVDTLMEKYKTNKIVALHDTPLAGAKDDDVIDRERVLYTIERHYKDIKVPTDNAVYALHPYKNIPTLHEFLELKNLLSQKQTRRDLDKDGAETLREMNRYMKKFNATILPEGRANAGYGKEISIAISSSRVDQKEYRVDMKALDAVMYNRGFKYSDLGTLKARAIGEQFNALSEMYIKFMFKFTPRPHIRRGKNKGKSILDIATSILTAPASDAEGASTSIFTAITGNNDEYVDVDDVEGDAYVDVDVDVNDVEEDEYVDDDEDEYVDEDEVEKPVSRGVLDVIKSRPAPEGEGGGKKRKPKKVNPYDVLSIARRATGLEEVPIVVDKKPAEIVNIAMQIKPVPVALQPANVVANEEDVDVDDVDDDVEEKIYYLREHKCSTVNAGNGKSCTFNASFISEDGRLLCGIHAKSDTKKTTKLPKRPT